MVPLGFKMACLRASWPTSRSPCAVKATTEGVVRDPSALGITFGLPASVAAMTELVVPRSIPTAIAIAVLLNISGQHTPRVGRPAGRQVPSPVTDVAQPAAQTHVPPNADAAVRTACAHPSIW